MVVALLLVIFSAVFFAFNLFIGGYIKSSVTQQLTELTTNFAKHDGIKENHSDLPDVSGQSKSKIGTQAQVFVLNTDYEVVKADDTIDEIQLAQMANKLKDENISLDGIKHLFIQTETDDYYISSIRENKDDHSYFLFFVNVTSIRELTTTINSVLGLIMFIFLVVSFFVVNLIAASITKPVKRLSEFAAEIGKGNFDKKELSFIDLELDNLSSVMNKSALQLERYDNEQKSFFQNVSHELRTPLMSIKCYAEGIEHGVLDKENSSRTIISETDRLSEMVEDLLYISKAETEKSLLLSENDVRETLSFCAGNLTPVADKQNKKFIYDFDNEPVILNYNENHMVRAFNNLISNAIRYAKSTITLSCHTVDSNVIISVLDDGNGISEVDIPHIFERFYKGKDGKHGIGLSIVKLVVDLHKGSITVSSDESTTFTMTFSK
jgi:signal transduction histidine kinase